LGWQELESYAMNGLCCNKKPFGKSAQKRNPTGEGGASTKIE
jgi:hypothetical protein